VKTHELKTLPRYWEAVWAGVKTFEVRRNDRGFEIGDELSLVNMATGQAIRRKVTYVLHGGQFGIEPGFVVMGIERDE